MSEASLQMVYDSSFPTGAVDLMKILLLDADICSNVDTVSQVSSTKEDSTEVYVWTGRGSTTF